MSFSAEELRIKSKDPDKQIEEIRRWAQKLIELLNYSMNHLDETNFNSDIAENVAGTAISGVVQDALNEQYVELRSLTIARTKGRAGSNSGYAVIGDVKICWGLVNIKTTTANVSASEAVKFPVIYNDKPNVQVTCQNMDPGVRVVGCSYDNLTETGCDIFITRTNTEWTKASWLAIGK